MDQQLLSQVSQRAGLSPDQATQAIQAVAEFLEDHLPGPFAAQVDSVISGQAGAGGMSGLGGTMGDQSDLPNQRLDDTFGDQP